MSDVNKVILVGRLGKEPQTRYTPGGVAVANFQVATGKAVKDKAGQYQKQTEWHNVVTFKKQAEFVSKSLHKGALVYIEGELHTRQWTDKRDNSTRYTTEVVAFVVNALEPKKAEQQQQSAPEPEVYGDDPF